MKRTKDLKMHPPSLAAQAQQHAAAAIAELVKIVENTSSHAARLAAITTLLDRGFGKPPKSLDIAIKDRETRAAQQRRVGAGGRRLRAGA